MKKIGILLVMMVVLAGTLFAEGTHENKGIVARTCEDGKHPFDKN